MLRIWSGDMVEIDEREFDREKILEQYRAFEKNRKVKFVVKSKECIIGVIAYRDILLKRNIRNNTIVKSNQVLDDALDYFQKIDNLYSGSSLGVVDEFGTLQFILEYFDNSNFIDSNKKQYFYQWFYDVPTKYDYDIESFNKLLDKIQIVVFQYAEEYSVHFAKMLLAQQQRFPNLKIYFLDKKAQFFFASQEITILSSCTELQENVKYLMIISEKYSDTKYSNTEQRKVYQSVEIMMLLYADKIAARLDPHNEEPFLIYNDKFDWSGIVDIMKFSVANYNIGISKNYIPVINISDNITYSDAKGENVWNYYFEPISGYSLEQAYSSNNYFIISRNNNQMMMEQIEEEKKNSYIEDKCIKLKDIKWKQEIKEYCESEAPKEFYENKRILGVIARGTDYYEPAVNARSGNMSIKNASIGTLIQKTKELMGDNQYDYIYLATEDYNNYSEFIKAFGDKVLATKQERIDLVKNRRYITTSIAVIPKAKWGFEYGLDYLVVLHCLGKCNSLLSSMDCGAYLGAIALNDNKYEKNIILENNNIMLTHSLLV